MKLILILTFLIGNISGWWCLFLEATHAKYEYLTEALKWFLSVVNVVWCFSTSLPFQGKKVIVMWYTVTEQQSSCLLQLHIFEIDTTVYAFSLKGITFFFFFTISRHTFHIQFSSCTLLLLQKVHQHKYFAFFSCPFHPQINYLGTENTEGQKR